MFLKNIMSTNQFQYVLLGRTRKAKLTRVLAVVLSAYAFGATGNVPILDEGLTPDVRTVTAPLELPTLADQINAAQAGPEQFIQTEVAGRGDTLAAMFIRLGIEDQAALSFIKKDKVAKQLLSLPAGKEIVVEKTETGELVSLRAPLKDADGTFLSLEKDGDTFRTKKELPALERRVEMRTALVESSLFVATDEAEVPDEITSKMIEMFSTRIDFSDLNRGDQFNVVYETFWDNGAQVKTGRILAAQFIHAGRAHQTLWFDDPYNKAASGYYSFDGKPLKKAFLKSPLAFSRVSSGFAMRTHPIAGDWRQHKGVDYSAPHGTPIRASGDGVAEFVGTQSGYGNVVRLKHMSAYSTVYAHLSRFSSGLKQGRRVTQGDVIGYVGATGWATGPHLHYEFRINNQPQNPLTIDVSSTNALAGMSLRKFKEVSSDMQHRFAVLAPVSNNRLLAMR